MIDTNSLLVETPFVMRAVAGAAFWVLSILIVIFHRAGAQVVGAVFVLCGGLGLVTGANPHLAILVAVFGFITHSMGRLLYRMRRR